MYDYLDTNNCKCPLTPRMITIMITVNIIVLKNLVVYITTITTAQRNNVIGITFKTVFSS